MVVNLAGSYGRSRCALSCAWMAPGLITTTYWLDSLPFHPPRARKLGVGTDVGGYREVGVAYILPGSGGPPVMEAQRAVVGLS